MIYRFGFLDLKFRAGSGHTSPFPGEVVAHEFRQNDFLSIDGLIASIRVPQMRSTVQRKLQSQAFHLLGPIPLHGLCSAHLSGEPSRYSDMSSCGSTQALSYGLSRQSLSQYAGQRQSGQRLDVAAENNLSVARNELSRAIQENETMRTSQLTKWFLSGALVLLCGLLIGVLVGRQQNKRRPFYD